MVARQGPGNLRLQTGTTDLTVTLKKLPSGLYAFSRTQQPPLLPRIETHGDLDYTAMDPVQGVTWGLDDFRRGLGGFNHKPGYYYYGDNVDSRWDGTVMPGPNLVNDIRTGIAANEKIVRHILVGADDWVCTSTTVYRSVAGTANWTEVGANGAGWAAGNPTDIVAFAASGGNPVIAVAMGSAVAYQYTVDNGTNWVTSTKAGNAKYANYWAVSRWNVDFPKVWYVTNPNQLYATADLLNTGVSLTPAFIGDSLNDEFTSLIEVGGLLHVGKRRFLYDGYGNILAGPYRYLATSLVGSFTGYPTRPANANFENPAVIDGRVYYIVEDDRIIEVTGGVVTGQHCEPKWWTAAPRTGYPIACIVAVGTELWAVLGTTDNALRDNSQLPGRTGLLANSTARGWHCYAGRRPAVEGGRWEWHGSLISKSTSLISTLSTNFDGSTQYLKITAKNLLKADNSIAQASVGDFVAGVGASSITRVKIADEGISTAGLPANIKTCYKITASGVSYVLAQLAVTAADASRHCESFYILRGSGTGGTNGLALLSGFTGATSHVQGTVVLSTTTWERPYSSWVISAGDLSGTMNINCSSGGLPSSGSVFYVTAIQFEALASGSTPTSWDPVALFSPGNQDWWLSCWLRPDNATLTADDFAVSKWDAANNRREYAITFDNTGDDIVAQASAAGTTVVTAGTHAASVAWKHVFVFFDAAADLLYVYVTNADSSGTASINAAESAALTDTFQGISDLVFGGIDDASNLWDGRLANIIFGNAAHATTGSMSTRATIAAAMYNGGVGARYSEITGANRLLYGVVDAWDLEQDFISEENAISLTNTGTLVAGDVEGVNTPSIPRYAWYQDNSFLLRFANAAQMAVNLSQQVCFAPQDNPLYQAVPSGFTNHLANGFAFETGLYTQQQPYQIKTMRRGYGSVEVGASRPIDVAYRVVSDDEDTGYTALASLTSISTARTGVAFPSGVTFRGARLKFTGTGGQQSAYPLLYNFQAVHHFYPVRYDYLVFTVVGGDGQVAPTGTLSRVSGTTGLRAALDAMRDAQDVITVTDLSTDEVYSCNLDRYEVQGMGQNQEWTVYLREVL